MIYVVSREKGTNAQVGMSGSKVRIVKQEKIVILQFIVSFLTILLHALLRTPSDRSDTTRTHRRVIYTSHSYPGAVDTDTALRQGSPRSSPDGDGEDGIFRTSDPPAHVWPR
jgi:hypothetical protein